MQTLINSGLLGNWFGKSTRNNIGLRVRDYRFLQRIRTGFMIVEKLSEEVKREGKPEKPFEVSEAKWFFWFRISGSKELHPHVESLPVLGGSMKLHHCWTSIRYLNDHENFRLDGCSFSNMVEMKLSFMVEEVEITKNQIMMMMVGLLEDRFPLNKKLQIDCNIIFQFFMSKFIEH